MDCWTATTVSVLLKQNLNVNLNMNTPVKTCPHVFTGICRNMLKPQKMVTIMISSWFLQAVSVGKKCIYCWNICTHACTCTAVPMLVHRHDVFVLERGKEDCFQVELTGGSTTGWYTQCWNCNIPGTHSISEQLSSSAPGHEKIPKA